MPDMLIFLFTTVSCPNCPGVKKMLTERNIPFLEIDAGTKEGLELARKHGISSVPTVIVAKDQEKAPVARFSGAPEITQNIELLEKGIARICLCSSPDSKK